MLALLLIGWAGSGEWTKKWHTLRTASASRATFVFMALVVFGLCYGPGGDTKLYFTKYLMLLLLPIMLSLHLSSEEKQRALLAFVMSMGLTLLLSYLLWLGWLPTGLLKNAAQDNPTVFKLHITQNFFMILAAFIFYMLSGQHASGKRRGMAALFITLVLINTMLLVQGRTGHVVLLGLLVYLFHLRFPRYGLLTGAVSALLMIVFAYSISPAFKARADTAIAEAAQWQDRRGDPTSSIGVRFDFYLTSLGIIRDHPWIGVGTGGFRHAYEEQIAGSSLDSVENPHRAANNPHNQFLLTTAQYGLLGLGILTFFFVTLWQQSKSLSPPFAVIAGGVIIAYLIGNLFNSFFFDFAERVFFMWAMGLLLSTSPNRDQPISGSTGR